MRAGGSGNANLFLGLNAGQFNTTTGGGNNGKNNTFVGNNSGALNATGYGNTGLGSLALAVNTSGVLNAANGYQALSANTTGSNNSAFGANALLSNTTGSLNSAFGTRAMIFNTTGSNNTVSGTNALYYNTTGSDNVVSGLFAGGFGYGDVMAISNSTLLGSRAGYNLYSGSNNIFLGYKAGESAVTATKNIVIGYDIDTPTDSSTNTLNIGNLLFGTGLDGTNTTISTGNIGIGTSNPTSLFSVGSSSQFQVSGTGAITSSTLNTNGGIIWSNAAGTLATSAAGSLGQCLTSNGAAAPSWTSCSSASSNYWQLNSSVLSPINSSYDLVVGGDSTASAKFIVNASTGYVGIGTTAPAAALDIAGNLQLNTGSIKDARATFAAGPLIFDRAGTGSAGSELFRFTASGYSATPLSIYYNKMVLNAGPDLQFGTGTWYGDVSFNGGAGAYGMKYKSIAWSGVAAPYAHHLFDTIGDAGSSPLLAVANNASWKFAVFGNGTVGIGTTSATAGLQLYNTVGGGAAAIFDQRNSGDIFTASAAGTPRFTIKNNGNLITSMTTAGGIVWTDATGLLSSVAGSAGQCLTSNGSSAPSWASCSALSNNYWQLNSSVLSPLNSSYDLAVGGSATSSAKFQVFASTGTASTSGQLTFAGAGTNYVNALNGQALSFRTSVGGDTDLTDRLTILNNGFVGIGTTTPTTKLQVNGYILAGIFNTIGSSTNNSSILGGLVNTISANSGSSSIVGGLVNTISSSNASTGSFIGAGVGNNILTFGSFNSTGREAIVGGDTNSINITYTADYDGMSFIGGGRGNSITASYASIVGGRDNTVSGAYGFAAGRRAKATAQGVFALADSTDADFTVGTANVFGARFNGGYWLTGGNVGIGTTNPLAPLQVTKNNQLSSLAIFDQLGSGDIFTASASGTPRFTIQNNGNLITSMTTAGGVVYTDGTGLLSSVAGSSNQCLLSGGTSAPSWGSCATGTTNYWQLNTSVLSPINSSYDLVVGGDSTAAGKFIVNAATGHVGIGVTTLANDGSNTATLDLFQSTTPTIHFGNTAFPNTNMSRNKISLTSDARAIVYEAGANGAATYGHRFNVDGSEKMRIEGNGYVGIGTTVPVANLHVGTTPYPSNRSTIGVLGSSVTGADTLLTLANTANPANNNTAVMNFMFGTNWTPTAEIGAIIINSATANTGLIFKTYGASLSEKMRIDGNGLVGIGTTAPAAALNVYNTYGGGAAAIFDNMNAGDLLAASASGTPRFSIRNNGDLITNMTTAGGIVWSDATGLLASSAAGSAGQCLTSNGASAPSWISCSSASSNYWQLNSSVLSPINSSYDLVVGGNSTASAKFIVNAATGYVGVGTTMPGAPVEILTASQNPAAVGLRIRNPGNNNGYGMNFYDVADNAGGSIYFNAQRGSTDTSTYGIPNKVTSSRGARKRR
jgi:hypothetical protein